MIPRQLNDVTEADLQSLVEDGVAERKTLDYKRDLPGNGDAETKDFLADVSSFANTAGGDLIFGIEAPAGVGEPTGIPGIPAAGIETEKLRLEGKIQAGISPRLPHHEIEHVSLSSGNTVLIIRVWQSWNGPHRVTAKGHGHFYGRNASGKYQLDVEELRRAFNLSESTAQQIRDFRASRIFSVKNDHLPTPVDDGPRLLIHAVPLQAFSSFSRPDFSDALRTLFRPGYGPVDFEPFSHTGAWGHEVNLEGRLVFPAAAGGRPAGRSYLQLFRSGILESLWALPLRLPNEIPFILCDQWVPSLMRLLPRYLAGMGKFGVEPPILLFLSILSASGCFLQGPNYAPSPGPLGHSDILFPEIWLDSLATELAPRLKPHLDMLWNACGAEQNPYIP